MQCFVGSYTRLKSSTNISAHCSSCVVYRIIPFGRLDPLQSFKSLCKNEKNSEEWQQLQAEFCLHLRLPLLLLLRYRTTTCDISKLQYRTMCNINVSPVAAYLFFFWEQLHFQYHLRTTANSFHQEVTAFSNGNCLSRSWY